MGAPIKQGIDYFPHTIGLMKDRKLRRAKLKFGSIAMDIYLVLLELIYGDKGYYIAYKGQEDEVIWDISEYLQGRFQPTPETVSDVIEELVACGLFSGDCYPEIITSERIQETYYVATVDRKAVSIIPGYWLLSVEKMRTLSGKSMILSFMENQPNNEVKRANNEVNRAINSQSTVKESTVKESKEENITPDGLVHESFLIKQIIDYLNLKCDTAYKASSELNKRHINARINEGYKLDDFICVIDKKVNDWKGTDNEKYLRPETLFGSKFENYLNAKITAKNSAPKYGQIGIDL